MTFEEWNCALSHHFFNPTRAGARVYLHTTKDLLRNLGPDQEPVADFISAIKAGPSKITHGGMCAKAVRLMKDWRQNANPSTSDPPYLAYLCLFALAASHDGPWPRHAYYPRLWDLLGESHSGAPILFRYMSDLLWRDLEFWTHKDRLGDYGLFLWQSALDWVYVGLPIAQTILTEEERLALPDLFDQADLEPGAVLPDGQLAAAIAPFAEGRLRRRTVQLLISQENSDYRRSLLELVQSELTDWDGIVAKSSDDESLAQRRAGLRLWLEEIDPAGFVTSRVVALVPDSLEPDDLLLQTNKFPNKTFECSAQSGRISDSLRDSLTNESLAADLLRWQDRTEFQCSQTGTRLILPGSPVRVFVSGASEVRGYLEIKKLSSHEDFFIATQPSVSVEIDVWGKQNCVDWKKLHVERGLPSDWSLFHGKRLAGVKSISSRFPQLAHSESLRVRFVGGVRTGNRSAYFPFALPQLIIDCDKKVNFVKLNGTVLQPGDEFRYVIPATEVQPVNQIDVEAEDHRTQATLFVLSDGWTWGDGAECPFIDQYGRASFFQPASFSVRGAIVSTSNIPSFAPDAESVLDEVDSATLLGRVPGQIVDLRRDEALPEWPVVWAVTTTRRHTLFAFAGTSLEDSKPMPSQSDKAARKWASFIQVNRRRTTPIKHPRIQKLLNTYREVARGI